MYNCHIIIGRVGKDVVVKQTQKGLMIAKFSVATKRKGSKDKSDWHDVVCFDKLASIAEKILQKGCLVMVEGETQNNSYEKDGVKKTQLQLVAEKIIRLSPSSKENSPDSFDDKLNKELSSNSGDSSLDDIPF